MPDGAETANVAFDWDIVRRVGNHDRGALILHQACVGCLVEGAAAKYSMLAEQPQIAGSAYRLLRLSHWQDIGRIFAL